MKPGPWMIGLLLILGVWFLAGGLERALQPPPSQEVLMEDCRRHLNLMERAGTPEIQITQRLARFKRLLHRDGLDGLENRYLRHLAGWLPPHAFGVFSIVTKAGARQKVLTFGSWDVPAFPDRMGRWARLPKPPSSLETEVLEGLRKLTGSVMASSSRDLREGRGRLRFYASDQGLRGFYWDQFIRRKDKSRLVYFALLRLDEIDPLKSLRSLLAGWQNSGVGLAYLPLGKGTPLMSSFFRHRPEIQGLLRDLAANPRRLGKRGIRLSDAFLLGGKPVLGGTYRPVVVLPLREDPRAIRPGEAFRLASGWILGVVLLWTFVEMTFRQRGPRPAVTLTILLAFVTVSLMPLSAARSIFVMALDEEARGEREETARRLHETLNGIDDQIRYAQADLFQTVRRLSHRPDVIQTLRRMEEANGGLPPASGPVGWPDLPGPWPDRPALEAFPGRLAYAAAAELHGGTLASRALPINIISIAGPGSFLRFFDQIEKKTYTQDSEIVQQGIGLFFQNLRWPYVLKIPAGLSSLHLPPGKLSATGLPRDELVVEESMKSFPELAGIQGFLDYHSYPERLNGFRTNNGAVMTTQTLALFQKRVRYILTWMWDEYMFGPVAIRRGMRRLGLLPVPPEDLFVFARIRQGLMSDDTSSLPDGLEDHPELEEVFDVSRSTNEIARHADASGAFLLQAMPLRNLSLFFLGGGISTAALQENAARRTSRMHFGLVLVLLLAVVGAFVLARWFTEPIRRLQEAMSRVDQGDYDQDLIETRQDEFGTLATAFNFMQRGLREGRLLGRHVSEAVKEAVRDQGRLAAAARGESRDVTVLFSGLVGFREIQASRSPAQVIEALQTHLEVISAACRECGGGDIDKVMGDKVLVIFDHGRLGGGPAAAAIALRVAARIEQDLRGRDHPLTPAIGLNSGSVIAGIIGARSVRLDFTVIGDAVNLASRLAGVARTLTGRRIVLSENTFRLVEGMARVERLPATRVRGKTQEVEVYLLR